MIGNHGETTGVLQVKIEQPEWNKKPDSAPLLIVTISQEYTGELVIALSSVGEDSYGVDDPNLIIDPLTWWLVDWEKQPLISSHSDIVSAKLSLLELFISQTSDWYSDFNQKMEMLFDGFSSKEFVVWLRSIPQHIKTAREELRKALQIEMDPVLGTCTLLYNDWLIIDWDIQALAWKIQDNKWKIGCNNIQIRLQTSSISSYEDQLLLSDKMHRYQRFKRIISSEEFMQYYHTNKSLNSLVDRLHKQNKRFDRLSQILQQYTDDQKTYQWILYKKSTLVWQKDGLQKKKLEKRENKFKKRYHQYLTDEWAIDMSLLINWVSVNFEHYKSLLEQTTIKIAKKEKLKQRLLVQLQQKFLWSRNKWTIKKTTDKLQWLEVADDDLSKEINSIEQRYYSIFGVYDELVGLDADINNLTRDVIKLESDITKQKDNILKNSNDSKIINRSQRIIDDNVIKINDIKNKIWCIHGHIDRILQSTDKRIVWRYTIISEWYARKSDHWRRQIQILSNSWNYTAGAWEQFYIYDSRIKYHQSLIGRSRQMYLKKISKLHHQKNEIDVQIVESTKIINHIYSWFQSEIDHIPIKKEWWRLILDISNPHEINAALIQWDVNTCKNDIICRENENKDSQFEIKQYEQQIVDWVDALSNIIISMNETIDNINRMIWNLEDEILKTVEVIYVTDDIDDRSDDDADNSDMLPENPSQPKRNIIIDHDAQEWIQRKIDRHELNRIKIQSYIDEINEIINTHKKMILMRR